MISRHIYTLIISILSLIVSIIALFVFICKIERTSIITMDTFVSVMATFIGLSVTLLIGFQIYSIISINDKLSKIDILKSNLTSTNSELAKLKDNLTILEQELKGNISESEASSFFNQKQYSDAFKSLNNALVLYVELDSKKEIIPILVQRLVSYLEKIDISEFNFKGGYLEIESFILLLEDNYLKIKTGKHYWAIKGEYRSMYDNAKKKMNKFKDEQYN